MEPLVSVIMPAYNAASYLAETIASVQAQIYTNWELLVVDDGSTDDTAAVVAACAQQDSRIRYIYQANARQGRARNNGIAQATGNLIAFLDADDLWLPHKLAVQVPALLGSDVGLVFSDSYVFRDAYNAAAPGTLLGAGRGRFAGPEAIARLAGENFIPILTVLATKAALEQGGGFDESSRVQYGEDYHLWLRMLLSGVVLLGLTEPLAAYRLSPASVTAYDNQNFEQLIRGVIDLRAIYPQHRSALHTGLHRHITRTGLESLARTSNGTFYAGLQGYLAATGRGYWQPLFNGLRGLRARKIALRAIYFIVNYL